MASSACDASLSACAGPCLPPVSYLRHPATSVCGVCWDLSSLRMGILAVILHLVQNGHAKVVGWMYGPAGWPVLTGWNILEYTTESHLATPLHGAVEWCFHWCVGHTVMHVGTPGWLLGKAVLAWLHGMCWPSGRRDGKRDGCTTSAAPCWHMWSAVDVALCSELASYWTVLALVGLSGFYGRLLALMTAVVTLDAILHVTASLMSSESRATGVLSSSCHRRGILCLLPVPSLRTGSSEAVRLFVVLPIRRLLHLLCGLSCWCC